MSWFLKGFLMTDIFHMYWLFVITTNSLLFKACKKRTQTQVHRHYHFLAHKANYMLNEILNKVTTCLHSTTAHNPHFWNCFLRTKNKSEARYNWLCCYTIWCAVLMGWKRNLQKNENSKNGLSIFIFSKYLKKITFMIRKDTTMGLGN